jgi:hypothetical protein
MNRDFIISRINELKEWQFKAQDLVNYNDFVKGYNTAVTFEIEFLMKLLAEIKS